MKTRKFIKTKKEMKNYQFKTGKTEVILWSLFFTLGVSYFVSVLILAM